MASRFIYPRPEYPRPDRQRGLIDGVDWLNLTGPWQPKPSPGAALRFTVPSVVDTPSARPSFWKADSLPYLHFRSDLLCWREMPIASATRNWRREARALLILGRVSNLPTVWSNCLAGWLLAGAGSAPRFGLLCFGTSCLYLGGMCLNDAFDVEFDRQHRQERPIPSGAITQAKVWGWGFGWLAAGVLLLSLLGKASLATALLLAGCIVLYDAIHKAVTLSPLLMALCRLLLYLTAASAATRGIKGLAIWSALALALYVVGLSYIARKESLRGPVRFWPAWLLGTPLLLAWFANSGEYKVRAVLFSVLLGAWILRSLSELYWTATPNVGRAVSGLLAGICLVDLLAVAGGSPPAGMALVLFFGAALLCQRIIPAT
jgi:hypothetical protein